MNSTQIQTTLAPLLTFLAGLAAGKGLFGWDAATWYTILGSVVGFGATIWAAVATKNSNLAAATQAMKGVDVTTSPAAPAGVASAVNAVKAAG